MLYIDYLAARAGYDTYEAYLRSDHWQTFSAGVRHTACFTCGATDKPLQVHHTTYLTLGHEHPTDVITVCNGCHLGIHELAKNGTPLARAHITQKSRMHSIRQKNTQVEKAKNSVSWFKLQNKSKHQSIGNLRSFLMEKGLSDGFKATAKAYELRFVSLIDDHEVWNRKRYIGLLKADKQLKKLQAEGKPISHEVYRRALETSS